MDRTVAQAAEVPRGTRILRRAEIAELLGLDDSIDAVEGAFRAHADGRTIPPGVLSAAGDGGAFHIKTAGLRGRRFYFAAKVNGNFYANGERYGLPRVQGVIVLSDAGNGYPLAVLDSIEITLRRTAAASTVAAKYLAPAASRVATVCGCGVQGRMHLAMLCRVRPIAKAFAYDGVSEVAERFAAEMSQELGIEVVATRDLGAATRQSQVVVTCTPAQEPLLREGDLARGAFIAAVGADSEEKQELATGLLASSDVVVDHLEQCATIGELHHALVDGSMRRSDVSAELHEVVSGRRPGRTSEERVVVFDSTGVALEDVAAAAVVFERAEALGGGSLVPLLEVAGPEPEKA